MKFITIFVGFLTLVPQTEFRARQIVLRSTGNLPTFDDFGKSHHKRGPPGTQEAAKATDEHASWGAQARGPFS